MKFLKAVFLASSLLLASISYAQGPEEICHNAVKSDLNIKRQLTENPESLKELLQYINNSSAKSLMKEMLREKAFWVYNRRDLPNDKFSQLSFAICMASQ